MERHARIAQRIVLVVLLALTSGCVTQPAVGPSPKTVRAEQADDHEGYRVAEHLTKRYGETATACPERPTLPLFLCSGIILRGTDYSPAYHSWVPNPNSPKGDGVSFSYLRQDARFTRLAYGYTHGFIVYPMVYNPGVVIDLEILCAFPIDAATDYRTSSGCGSHRNYASASGPCQAQDITTAVQWVNHYRTPGVNGHEYQCGFTVVSGTPNAPAMFLAVLEAMRALDAESLAQQNELIIASWKNTPNQIGIEAFFYLNTSGRADSMNEQADFNRTVGVWRPVIKMDLPTATSPARFTYDPNDQTGR